jgi:hypothetical protein
MRQHRLSGCHFDLSATTLATKFHNLRDRPAVLALGGLQQSFIPQVSSAGVTFVAPYPPARD